jgi:peroxiredoxin
VDLDLFGVANRAVYVLDTDGRVVYEWEADSPENEELLEAVESA